MYVLLLIVWGEVFPSFMKKNLNYKLGDTGHMHTRLKEVKTQKDVDLVFLGSSLTYRGLDTRLFGKAGYNSFNLGSSSQTPIQSLLLAKRYLKTLNPDLVLCQVDPEAFAADGVESSLDIIANELNDKHSLRMVFQIGHLKTINAFIFGIYRDLIGRNNSYIEEPIKNGDSYILGGFVQKEMGFASKQQIPGYEFKFNLKQKESFEDLLALMKDQEVKYMLVYPPVTSAAYNACKNISYFDSCMNSYGNYINYNEEIELNDSLAFYDAYHLNQHGVQTFNQKVIDGLLSKNDLK